MAATWVLVADRSDARVFEQKAGGTLKRLRHIPHPASRMQNRDLESDRQGSVGQSVGGGMHSMSHEQDPKAHEAEVFAQQLAELLHDARARGECGKLWIVAEPGFLGMLRQNLDGPTEKIVVGTLDRNLTHELDREVERHLAASMRKGEVRAG